MPALEKELANQKRELAHKDKLEGDDLIYPATLDVSFPFDMGIPLSIGIGGSESKRRVLTGIRRPENSSLWLCRQSAYFLKTCNVEENKPSITHRKPSNLKTLCDRTKFSRIELQALYRSFKQECPSGLISEEAIRDIYSRFFPQGDTTQYSQLVFRLLDNEGGGSVTFEGLISNLSILLKGSLKDRLDWIFKLYDRNEDGFISKDELRAVISSIHQIVVGAKNNCSAEERRLVTEHVDYIFQKMDSNQDGLIDMVEFTNFCLGEPHVCRGLEAMDLTCDF